MSILVGQQIAHYQIQALLGQGRIGTVYQAINLEDQCPVALKVVSLHLTQQPEFRRRFLQEVQAIPRLDHPSIVKVHEAGVDTEQDILYMTMDYVTERSLMVYLQQLKWRNEVMRPGEALLIGAQVADALDYAHQKSVIHRDIRPNVILFKRDEESAEIGGLPRRAAIGDFALASVLEGETEPFSPSLPYLSPEQCLRQSLDGRADIYSLGVVLYQLLVDQLPFDVDSLDDAIRKHQYQDATPLRQLRPDLPAAVEDIVMKAISKRPEDRYQTASEFAEALRHTVQAMPDALSISPVEDEIGRIDTLFESQELLAAQANLWTTDEDRVTITENVPHSLNRQIITIGRSENNDIVLPSTNVTRRHAQLERMESGWQIRDLGSRNGTILDGHPLLPDIPEEWVSHQTLRIGPYFLQLQEGKGFSYHRHPLEVTVTPNEIDVAPGKEKELQVTIVNQGTAPEEFNIRVERLPASWVTSPEGDFQLKPSEQVTIAIKIHPPLRQDIITGNSRYLLVVNPLTPNQKDVTVPGSVNVELPEDAFALDLYPTELTGKGIAQLVIRNEGIVEADYTITGRNADDGIQFGELRARQPEPGTARPGSRSQPTRPSAGASSLKRLPFLRRLSYAPRNAMNQLLRVPRQALNRILPGMGSMIRPESIGRQVKRPAGSTKVPSPPVRPDPRNFDRIMYPGQIHTKATIAAGQQQALNLIIEPRKRPFMGRQIQTHPFQIQVSTSNNVREALSGQLTVTPRIRTIAPAGLIVILAIFLCLFSSLLYATTINKTLAAIVSSPFDIDGDGLSNLAETYLHKTDPNSADSDQDGLSDGQEIELALFPNNPDTDQDGLLDGEEQAFSTDPRIYDTDGDELSDSLEIRVLNTDPLAANTLPIGPGTEPTPTTLPVPTPPPTPIPTPLPSSEQMTFTSNGRQDGFVGVEGGGALAASGLAINEGESLQVGDDISDGRQFKGIISFDTSSLPDDALIQTVQLRIRRSGSAGKPYNLGQLHIDIAPASGFGGSSVLAIEDFSADAAVVNVTSLSRAADNGSWAQGMLDAAHADAVNRKGITQFRIYFTLPNDGNSDRDWITFNAGDHPNKSFHPELIVTYELP